MRMFMGARLDAVPTSFLTKVLIMLKPHRYSAMSFASMSGRQHMLTPPKAEYIGADQLPFPLSACEDCRDG